MASSSLPSSSRAMSNNSTTVIIVVVVVSVTVILCAVVAAGAVFYGRCFREQRWVWHRGRHTSTDTTQSLHSATIRDSIGDSRRSSGETTRAPRNPLDGTRQSAASPPVALAVNGGDASLRETVRVLPNGQVIRTVPVIPACEDESQMWRRVDTSALAGDALRLVSTTHPRRSSSAPTGQQRLRSSKAQYYPALHRPSRAQESREKEEEEGEDTRVFQPTARRGTTSSSKNNFSDDSTESDGSDDESNNQSTRSGMWCADGIPQYPSRTSLNPPHSDDAHESERSETMSQESMPWHAYRNNRRYLLIYPDGNTALTSQLESWQATQTRHRYREEAEQRRQQQQQQQQQHDQTQRHQRARAATMTMGVAVDAAPRVDDASSRGRSSSLLSRVLRRQSRRGESSVATAAHTPPPPPPPLSPVDAQLPASSPAPAPPHGSSEHMSAVGPETGRTTAVSVLDAGSPVNVVAPATVLVMEPLPAPGSPERTFQRPDAARVYGKGSAYLTKRDEPPLP